MAKVTGKVLIDTERGVVAIEVPERGAAGLLRDGQFEPASPAALGGLPAGVVGKWCGVPVLLRVPKPRK